MKGLDEIISALSAQRRAKIEERAAVLILEQETALLYREFTEEALRDLQEACELTAERIAELLGVGDEDVFRPGGQADISFSKLRDEIATMGGFLDLVVRLPDKPPVSLSSLLSPEAKRRKLLPKSSDKSRATRRPA